MALASQRIQSGVGNRYMSNVRRRRGRRPVVALVVLAALVGAGAWWYWKGSPAEDDANVPMAEGESDRFAPPPVEGSVFILDAPADEAPAASRRLAEETAATPTPEASGAVASAPDTAHPADPGDAVPPDPVAEPEPEPAPRPAASADDPPGASPPSAPGAASLAQALAAVSSDPLRARRELTRLLDGTTLTPAERRLAYDAIYEVNGPLFFRSGVVQGDTVFVLHKVESGDTPTSIVRRLGAECEGDAILRVNEIADARRIQVGRTLKVPKGPFHAEIRKGEFRLNLFHGEGPDRVMIASYPVGLGEFNTTPTGLFKVRPRSKLKNPQWTNPRTGEFFAADDPKNPIGERWIGLEGIEPHNRDFAGYGIHGTIEPESIGRMQSMGCVRMRHADVEVVYDLLTVPNSVVVIAP